MTKIASRLICSAIVCLAFFALCAFGATAQAPELPISWRVTAKMTSPTEGVLTMRPAMNDGWHIYGTEAVENGPMPTSFVFDNASGVEFTSNIRPSEPARSEFQEMFGTRVTYWGAGVKFTRTFKTSDPAKVKISGKIHYMGCNDSQCMPPQTNTFSITPRPYRPAK